MKQYLELCEKVLTEGHQKNCLLYTSLVTHEETTSEQRETAFHQMIEIALNLAK